MSSIKNYVHLLGNIGDDPKVTNLESGKKVARTGTLTQPVFRLRVEWHMTGWHYLGLDRLSTSIYLHKPPTDLLRCVLLPRDLTCYFYTCVPNSNLSVGPVFGEGQLDPHPFSVPIRHLLCSQQQRFWPSLQHTTFFR